MASDEPASEEPTATTAPSTAQAPAEPEDVGLYVDKPPISKDLFLAFEKEKLKGSRRIKGDEQETKKWTTCRKFKMRLWNICYHVLAKSDRFKKNIKKGEMDSIFLCFTFGGNIEERSVIAPTGNPWIWQTGKLPRWICRTPIHEETPDKFEFPYNSAFNIRASYLDLEEEDLVIQLWSYSLNRSNKLLVDYKERLLNFLKGSVFQEKTLALKDRYGKTNPQAQISFHLSFQEVFDFKLNFCDWSVKDVAQPTKKTYKHKLVNKLHPPHWSSFRSSSSGKVKGLRFSSLDSLSFKGTLVELQAHQIRAKLSRYNHLFSISKVTTNLSLSVLPEADLLVNFVPDFQNPSQKLGKLVGKCFLDDIPMFRQTGDEINISDNEMYLFVKIVSIDNLFIRDQRSTEFCDSLVEVSYDKQTKRTQVVQDTISPDFSCDLVYPVYLYSGLDPVNSMEFIEKGSLSLDVWCVMDFHADHCGMYDIPLLDLLYDSALRPLKSDTRTYYNTLQEGEVPFETRVFRNSLSLVGIDEGKSSNLTVEAWFKPDPGQLKGFNEMFPKYLAQQKHPTRTCVSAEIEDYQQSLVAWKVKAKGRMVMRTFSGLREFPYEVLNSRGLTRFLSCLIEPIYPPASIQSPEKIAHFTSCIPFFEKVPYWTTTERFLTARVGDVTAHTLLFVNLMTGLEHLRANSKMSLDIDVEMAPYSAFSYNLHQGYKRGSKQLKAIIALGTDWSGAPYVCPVTLNEYGDVCFWDLQFNRQFTLHGRCASRKNCVRFLRGDPCTNDLAFEKTRRSYMRMHMKDNMDSHIIELVGAHEHTLLSTDVFDMQQRGLEHFLPADDKEFLVNCSACTKKIDSDSHTFYFFCSQCQYCLCWACAAPHFKGADQVQPGPRGGPKNQGPIYVNAVSFGNPMEVAMPFRSLEVLVTPENCFMNLQNENPQRIYYDLWNSHYFYAFSRTPILNTSTFSRPFAATDPSGAQEDGFIDDFLASFLKDLLKFLTDTRGTLNLKTEIQSDPETIEFMSLGLELYGKLAFKKDYGLVSLEEVRDFRSWYKVFMARTCLESEVFFTPLRFAGCYNSDQVLATIFSTCEFLGARGGAGELCLANYAEHPLGVFFYHLVGVAFSRGAAKFKTRELEVPTMHLHTLEKSCLEIHQSYLPPILNCATSWENCDTWECNQVLDLSGNVGDGSFEFKNQDFFEIRFGLRNWEAEEARIVRLTWENQVGAFSFQLDSTIYGVRLEVGGSLDPSEVVSLPQSQDSADPIFDHVDDTLWLTLGFAFVVVSGRTSLYCVQGQRVLTAAHMQGDLAHGAGKGSLFRMSPEKGCSLSWLNIGGSELEKVVAAYIAEVDLKDRIERIQKVSKDRKAQKVQTERSSLAQAYPSASGFFDLGYPSIVISLDRLEAHGLSLSGQDLGLVMTDGFCSQELSFTLLSTRTDFPAQLVFGLSCITPMEIQLKQAGATSLDEMLDTQVFVVTQNQVSAGKHQGPLPPWGPGDVFSLEFSEGTRLLLNQAEVLTLPENPGPLPFFVAQMSHFWTGLKLGQPRERQVTYFQKKTSRVTQFHGGQPLPVIHTQICLGRQSGNLSLGFSNCPGVPLATREWRETRFMVHLGLGSFTNGLTQKKDFLPVCISDKSIRSASLISLTKSLDLGIGFEKVKIHVDKVTKAYLKHVTLYPILIEFGNYSFNPPNASLYYQKSEDPMYPSTPQHWRYTANYYWHPSTQESLLRFKMVEMDNLQGLSLSFEVLKLFGFSYGMLIAFSSLPQLSLDEFHSPHVFTLGYPRGLIWDGFASKIRRDSRFLTEKLSQYDEVRLILTRASVRANVQDGELWLFVNGSYRLRFQTQLDMGQPVYAHLDLNGRVRKIKLRSGVQLDLARLRKLPKQ